MENFSFEYKKRVCVPLLLTPNMIVINIQSSSFGFFINTYSWGVAVVVVLIFMGFSYYNDEKWRQLVVYVVIFICCSAISRFLYHVYDALGNKLSLSAFNNGIFSSGPTTERKKFETLSTKALCLHCGLVGDTPCVFFDVGQRLWEFSLKVILTGPASTVSLLPFTISLHMESLINW